MFAIQRPRSSSSSTSLSLSPSGWSPSRSTISPPTTTVSPSSGLDYFSFPTLRPRRSSSSSSSSSSSTIPLVSTSFAEAHTTSHVCAYPSWPARSSLCSTSASTPSSSVYGPYQPANSRISDEDLEDLDFSAPAGAELGALGEGMGLGISWSAVGNVVEKAQQQQRRRLPPPPTEMQMHAGSSKRRRSSSRGMSKKRSPARLGAIAE